MYEDQTRTATIQNKSHKEKPQGMLLPCWLRASIPQGRESALIPRLYIVVVQSLNLGAGRDQDGWPHLGNEAGSCIVGRSKRKVRRSETEVGIKTSCELILKRCSKSSGRYDDSRKTKQYCHRRSDWCAGRDENAAPYG